MKRRPWWIFAVVQIIGALGVFSAMYVLQFPTILFLSLLYLLPGSLVWLPALKSGQFEGAYAPWALCAMSVSANFLLFATISSFVSKRRKSS